jgi:hypothetical protein
MIQVNELRLGNYVYYADNKTVLKVDGGHICYPSKMHPIPLSEEILLKCGFVKYNTKDINPTYSKKLFNWNDGILYLIGDGFVNHIKYLHQLQNLYFALKNEELEINL